MTYWQIEKWRRYQHYTDRQPPWVKFHVKFLDDADLADLRRDSRLVAALLLLVAARTDNRIPDSPRIIAGWTNLPTRTVGIAMKELEKIGYVSLRNETEAETKMAQLGQERLDLASGSLAEDASARVRPRARGEAETDKEELPSNATSTSDDEPALPGRPEPLERLIDECGARNTPSERAIRAIGEPMPEHVQARALESFRGRQPRPDNPIGYAIGCLKAIAADTGRDTPTIDREPPI